MIICRMQIVSVLYITGFVYDTLTAKSPTQKEPKKNRAHHLGPTRGYGGSRQHQFIPGFMQSSCKLANKISRHGMHAVGSIQQVEPGSLAMGTYVPWAWSHTKSLDYLTAPKMAHTCTEERFVQRVCVTLVLENGDQLVSRLKMIQRNTHDKHKPCAPNRATCARTQTAKKTFWFPQSI